MRLLTDRQTFRDYLWLASLGAVGLCIFAAMISGFRLSVGSATQLVSIVIVMIISLCIRPDRFGRLQPVVQIMDATLMFVVIGMAGAVASYVAMYHSGVLMDQTLDRIDALMGFRWPAIRAFVDARPTLLAALENGYLLCFRIPLALIVLLAFTRRSERLYRFLAVYAVALALTVFVAFFFPAEAAFAFYEYQDVPNLGQHYGRIITELRSNRFYEVDLSDLGGIVTFPSFHASMAVIFAWAAWPIRVARVPMVLANAVMGVSAVPIGGHYVVDLFGGTAVAITSILVVRHRGMSTSSMSDGFVDLSRPVNS